MNLVSAVFLLYWPSSSHLERRQKVPHSSGVMVPSVSQPRPATSVKCIFPTVKGETGWKDGDVERGRGL